MVEEPLVHVGIVRRVKDNAGGHTEYVVNLSRIPLTASREVIDMMLGQVSAGFEAISAEIDARVRGVVIPNPAAFHPHVDPQRESVTPPKLDPEPNDPAPTQIISLIGAELAAHEADRQDREADPPDAPAPLDEDYDFEDGYNNGVTVTGEAIPGGMFHSSFPLPANDAFVAGEIPADEDVRGGAEAFGVEIDYPPYDWLSEPITKVGADGTDGGQCKALNSALTGAGYGGKLRHSAALAILQDYGAIHDHGVRDELVSLNDLSKAEASILLNWFDRAGRYEIAALAAALAPRKVAANG